MSEAMVLNGNGKTRKPLARSGFGFPAACALLAVLVGICIGIVAGGLGPKKDSAKAVYARFLARNAASYSLDGRLDLRLGMSSGGDGIGSAIPVTVSLGFSDTSVDHSSKGKTSMNMSVLDLSDGYELENYADYDSEGNSFQTYSRVRTGAEGGWSEWTVQDGYALVLDSRALFRDVKLLDGSVEAEDGIYKLAAQPAGVWDALRLEELVRSVTGAESIDHTAYLASAAKSTAVYEMDAGTGYLLAVDADGFVMDVDGTSVRASFRVEFSGYGAGGDVSVPESVMASASYSTSVPAGLLELPGGQVESVTGTTVEDVDRDSWAGQFSGDYGFDVVKYEDGTWHVLDMDGNEVEGAKVYDDGSVYHPEYGRIYPDYETDNG